MPFRKLIADAIASVRLQDEAREQAKYYDTGYNDELIHHGYPVLETPQGFNILSLSSIDKTIAFIKANRNNRRAEEQVKYANEMRYNLPDFVSDGYRVMRHPNKYGKLIDPVISGGEIKFLNLSKSDGSLTRQLEKLDALNVHIPHALSTTYVRAITDKYNTNICDAQVALSCDNKIPTKPIPISRYLNPIELAKVYTPLAIKRNGDVIKTTTDIVDVHQNLVRGVDKIVTKHKQTMMNVRKDIVLQTTLPNVEALGKELKAKFDNIATVAPDIAKANDTLNNYNISTIAKPISHVSLSNDDNNIFVDETILINEDEYTPKEYIESFGYNPSTFINNFTLPLRSNITGIKGFIGMDLAIKALHALKELNEKGSLPFELPTFVDLGLHNKGTCSIPLTSKSEEFVIMLNNILGINGTTILDIAINGVNYYNYKVFNAGLYTDIRTILQKHMDTNLPTYEQLMKIAVESDTAKQYNNVVDLTKLIAKLAISKIIDDLVFTSSGTSIGTGSVGKDLFSMAKLKSNKKSNSETSYVGESNGFYINNNDKVALKITALDGSVLGVDGEVITTRGVHGNNIVITNGNYTFTTTILYPLLVNGNDAILNKALSIMGVDKKYTDVIVGQHIVNTYTHIPAETVVGFINSGSSTLYVNTATLDDATKITVSKNTNKPEVKTLFKANVDVGFGNTKTEEIKEEEIEDEYALTYNIINNKELIINGILYRFIPKTYDINTSHVDILFNHGLVSNCGNESSAVAVINKVKDKKRIDPLVFRALALVATEHIKTDVLHYEEQMTRELVEKYSILNYITNVEQEVIDGIRLIENQVLMSSGLIKETAPVITNEDSEIFESITMDEIEAEDVIDFITDDNIEPVQTTSKDNETVDNNEPEDTDTIIMDEPELLLVPEAEAVNEDIEDSDNEINFEELDIEMFDLGVILISGVGTVSRDVILNNITKDNVDDVIKAGTGEIGGINLLELSNKFK